MSHAPGLRVGHYRLVKLVGRGGMGDVWEAHDEHLKRRVAIKFIRDAGQADEIARFKREASLAARLDHPGIAAIYEAGELDGLPWIAMAFVGSIAACRKYLEAHPNE